MSASQEALIETAARAMQAVSRPSVSPDQLTPGPRGTVGLVDIWKLYEHMATAAVDVIEATIRKDERERAAKIAEEEQEASKKACRVASGYENAYRRGRVDAAMAISVLIRNQGHP